MAKQPALDTGYGPKFEDVSPALEASLHRFTLFATAQMTSSADFDLDTNDSSDYRYSAVTVGGAYRL